MTGYKRDGAWSWIPTLHLKRSWTATTRYAIFQSWQWLHVPKKWSWYFFYTLAKVRKLTYFWPILIFEVQSLNQCYKQNIGITSQCITHQKRLFNPHPMISIIKLALKVSFASKSIFMTICHEQSPWILLSADASMRKNIPIGPNIIALLPTQKRK